MEPISAYSQRLIHRSVVCIYNVLIYKDLVQSSCILKASTIIIPSTNQSVSTGLLFKVR